MTFGKKLRSLRLKSKLTLHEISSLLDIRVSYLSDVEHGRKKPLSRGLIIKFSEIVEANVNELLSLAEEERGFVEIPVKSSRLNSKYNDLVFSLARSAETGDDTTLLEAIEKLQRNVGLS